MNSGIALVFPGQGAQAVGMGRDFYDREPLARTMFDEAAGILGYDLAQLCFDGTKEEEPSTRFLGWSGTLSWKDAVKPRRVAWSPRQISTHLGRSSSRARRRR